MDRSAPSLDSWMVVYKLANHVVDHPVWIEILWIAMRAELVRDLVNRMIVLSWLSEKTEVKEISHLMEAPAKCTRIVCACKFDDSLENYLWLRSVEMVCNGSCSVCNGPCSQHNNYWHPLRNSRVFLHNYMILLVDNVNTQNRCIVSNILVLRE